MKPDSLELTLSATNLSSFQAMPPDIKCQEISAAQSTSGLISALTKTKPRLFSPTTTKVKFQTVHSSEDDDDYGNIETDLVLQDRDFNGSFKKHARLPGATFIYVFQDHSWAPLNISTQSTSQILSLIKAPDELLRILQGFGHPNQSFGTDCAYGYGSRIIQEDAGKIPTSNTISHEYAFAYILGYIAKTGRSSNPWSERKMGVYHEFSNRRELWVILQPTKVALDLPSSYLNLSKHRMSPHTLLFSSSFPTSTAYLQYLENQIKTKSRKVRQPVQKASNELSISMVQDLQYHSELLHNAHIQFESNKEVLNGLRSIITGYSDEIESFDQLATRHQVMSCVSQIEVSLKWIHSMLQLIEQISNLMTMLSYVRQIQATSENTSRLTCLTEASRKDQDTMLNIAMSAKKDSELMKVIAITSLITLPTILTTGLFSTGFVTSGLSAGVAGEQSRVTNQALIYTFTTLALTTFVSAALYLWYQRNQLKY
ncbi:hypothetical protein V3481_014044 [Fusarium oxysporum f. sp. vasinfectum]|uniref:CorA-like transporter domain-containing protein n=1 Tax=Fusarium oxysporum f. sp. vasinfectum 25433 TaxID=1089449 RepID=X0LJK1_FUSOX|nr:hypothetical protein FOTG_07174 [Fusarium oxysporum f. sp. vasinfectum 25433]